MGYCDMNYKVINAIERRWRKARGGMHVYQGRFDMFEDTGLSITAILAGYVSRRGHGRLCHVAQVGMKKLPRAWPSGVPGTPSRFIEMSMTSKYYDSLISDLFLLFAMPSIERGAWRVMQCEALEREIWKRLDLKLNTL